MAPQTTGVGTEADEPTSTGQITPTGHTFALARPAEGFSVAELARAAKAQHQHDNTDDAFAQDWRVWERFVATATDAGVAGLSLTKADPDSLVVFVQWLAEGQPGPDGQPTGKPAAPATMQRRVTGVISGWKRRGALIPQGISGPARDWIKDHHARLVAGRQPTGRGQAPAVTVKQLRALVAATDPDTIGGYRDRALILVGFAIAARRSELAYLDVDDLTEQDEGLDVHIRRSKTGERHVPVIPGQNRETCPVRAWRSWLTVSGVTNDAAFRQVDRHDKVRGRLSGQAVGNIVTRTGLKAGLPKHITGHSLRSGLATEARRGGHTVEQIADQGGWSRTSPALHGYIRNVDRWTDNVLAGIGL